MKKIACSILLLLVAFVAMAQDTKQMPSHEQLTELFKMYDQMQSELDSTGQNPSKNLFMSIVGSGKDINERTQAMRQKLRELLGDKSVILDEYINSLAEANDSTDVHAFTQLTLKMVLTRGLPPCAHYINISIAQNISPHLPTSECSIFSCLMAQKET